MKIIIKHALTEDVKEISEHEDLQYWRDNGWAVINRIPENIEDEDFLNGDAYPGHEIWKD